MKNKVILIGGFSEIIELCELCNYEIIGIVDNNLKESYMGYEIIGGDKSAEKIYKTYKNIKLVVTPDLPKTRKLIVRNYSKIGFRFCNLISPRAVISKSCNIGNGVIIQTNVNVSSNTVIGDFVKLNTYSNIMHDCKIGNYTTIAPNAVLLGRVKVNDSCYIGANATVLPGKELSKNSIIGAGAVVTRDIGKGIVAAGNPAKQLITK